jgi:hypothetical protein
VLDFQLIVSTCGYDFFDQNFIATRGSNPSVGCSMPNFSLASCVQSFNICFSLFLLVVSQAPSLRALFHLFVSSLVTSPYKSSICSSDATVGSNIVSIGGSVDPTSLKGCKCDFLWSTILPMYGLLLFLSNLFYRFFLLLFFRHRFLCLYHPFLDFSQ